ncbi:glycosyltransferase [Mycolicibacterium pulveris]|uniref:glycosyltransferase n=1 Tax=Mycolicibacterium pulveris TaxID=36813 RepID=UPI003CE780B9
MAKLTVICADSGADQGSGALRVDWRIVGPPRTGRMKSVLSRWPLIAWKGATPDFLDELDTLLQNDGWDALVLDNIGLAYALPRVEAYRRAHPETKVLYVSHEWEYQTRARKYRSYRMNLAARLMVQLDLRKVKRWEDALIARCDIVTVINPSDLHPFRLIDPNRKYLPITPGYDGPAVSARRITNETPRRVLMLGGRRSEQKQQVLLDWLATAYERLVAADIELVVAGDIDSELFQRVCREYPKTRVLGFVDDLTSLIAEARIGLIADTVGGGFKLRLLTHVFNRLPIVGLAAAIDGLPTPAGDGYLTAATVDDLATLICDVIDDLERLNAVQDRAYRDCAPAFSWEERARSLTVAIMDRNETCLR